jgi:hypothetical protein
VTAAKAKTKILMVDDKPENLVALEAAQVPFKGAHLH